MFRRKSYSKTYNLTTLSSLIVLKGRRRIGKSALIDEFSKKFKKTFNFTGLPPSSATTAESQRLEFANQLSQMGIPGVSTDKWSALFWHLAQHVSKGEVLVSFDEISWMGSKDPDFLGQVWVAWEKFFKKNPQLCLILCGSLSSWIEKNILSDTGFLGRVSLVKEIKELPLHECNKFWGQKKDRISAYEKFQLLSVTGGIPRYLEEVQPNLSAEENIKQLCFQEGGVLFNEFENIFSDLFSKKSETYRKIVHYLVDGSKERKDIVNALNWKSRGGRISDYLKELVLSGFLSCDRVWSISTGKEFEKISKYRLSDNYVRFYLKYIFPNRRKIARGGLRNASLYTFSGWDTIMGLQFENLVTRNSLKLQKHLKIKASDVEIDGPYYQRAAYRQNECQIDYMIQTR